MPGLLPHVDAHAIIDYFISGSTNKANSSNEKNKKRFWLIVSISEFLTSLAIK